jgi:LysR family transcriptional activator of nhaA
LFVAPSLVSEAICRQYGVEEAGALAGVHERFYLITAQRKIQHPSIVAILEQFKRTNDPDHQEPGKRLDYDFQGS